MELVSTAIAPIPSKRRAVESALTQLLSPKPGFELVSGREEKSTLVQNFIVEKFEAIYGAKVHEFLPYFLTMTCLGRVSGVAGLRPAHESKLFLEQYLNEPIEVELEKLLDHSVSRQSVVEVGNLAASKAGSSQIVFVMFTTMLHLAGYQWIVFSATNTLLITLSKLGFATHELAEADPDRLRSSNLQEWGSYYQANPKVVVGNLDNAMKVIEKRPLFREVMRHYKPRIEELAQEFKQRT